MRLDYKEKFPSGMEEYLKYYGWHFSKKMAEWASKRMFKIVNGNKESISPYSIEQLNALQNNYNITLTNYNCYDALYIANMCKADFLGSSVVDEFHLLKYVKDVLEDSDSYEGMPFTRFYADCIGSGTPINWEDML